MSLNGRIQKLEGLTVEAERRRNPLPDVAHFASAKAFDRYLQSVDARGLVFEPSFITFPQEGFEETVDEAFRLVGERGGQAPSCKIHPKELVDLVIGPDWAEGRSF
jgi:hypothetical protein